MIQIPPQKAAVELYRDTNQLVWPCGVEKLEVRSGHIIASLDLNGNPVKTVLVSFMEETIIKFLFGSSPNYCLYSVILTIVTWQAYLTQCTEQQILLHSMQQYQPKIEALQARLDRNELNALSDYESFLASIRLPMHDVSKKLLLLGVKIVSVLETGYHLM